MKSPKLKPLKKKRYSGFILLVVLFMLTAAAIPRIPGFNRDYMVPVLFNAVNVWIALLSAVVRKNRQVYWFSGVSFHDSTRATPESVEIFTQRRLQWSLIVVAVFGAFSAIAVFAHLSDKIVLIVEVVCVLGMNFITSGYKLDIPPEEEENDGNADR